MAETDETVIAAWLAAVLHEQVQPLATAQLLVSQAAEHLERAGNALRRATQGADVLRWLVRVLRKDDAATMLRSPCLVRSALGTVAPFCAGLSVDVPAHLSVLAVPGALELVLDNLLANARKHASGAAVAVRAKSADASEVPWLQGSLQSLRGRVVLLTVADDGPGVADERLFEPFASAEAGSGIGLWLCRRVVRAHGGDLWREPMQRGAAFTSAWIAASPQHPDAWPRDPHELGKALRDARDALRLTRAQLAVMAGVADSTIRNVETGRHQPTQSVRCALFDALARCTDASR